MTLMMHPDKCCSVAAEGAMELLNSAWEVLSDPERKENRRTSSISVFVNYFSALSKRCHQLISMAFFQLVEVV
ncbi:hypothetical protein ACOSQ2_017699 [Xanthoceras sorbifolium]